jgi:hypothetical protein
VTVNPAADTFVNQSRPNRSFASNQKLTIAGGSSARQGFLRFNLDALPAGAAIKAARLRLTVTNGSSSGGIVSTLTNITWAEDITWNTRPAIDGSRLANLGTVSTGSVVELDVTPVVTGIGVYSFAIVSPDTTTEAVAYASRENLTASSRPQLVLTLQSAEPTSTNPIAPTFQPVATPRPTASQPTNTPPQSTNGTSYVVALDGNDNNPGTPTLPFRTLARGVSNLKPKDTLLVKPGTYAEALAANIPSGADWNQAVTLKAYDPNNRPVLQPPSGNDRVLFFGIFQGQAVHHIVIDGFILDGTNVAVDNVKITDGAHHIRIINSDVKNAPSQGVLITGIGSQYNEFINLDVSNNGINEFTHGMYISTSNNLIEYCRVHDNAAWGIHVYNEHPEWQDDMNVVRHNLVYNNARVGPRGVGIGLYSGTGHIAYDNIVWGNNNGIVVNYNAAGVKVYNNTVYGNNKSGGEANILIGSSATNSQIINNIVANHAAYGILNQSPAGSSTLIRNNIAYQNAKGDIKDDTGTALLSANVIGANPMFVDIAKNNFHLLPGSPAIDTGVTLAEVPDDGDNRARPQGLSYDIGAYEYIP